MAQKTPRRTAPAKPAADPAAAANRAVLAERQARIDKQLREIPDLGLDLQQTGSVDEFLRDEFDKKAFGDAAQTTTKIVFGPDPLLDSCPAFKERLEKLGREDMAEGTRRAILQFEHRAVPDPVMQTGLFKAIRKFGKEAVAQSFADRILKIPERVVEYETGPEEFGDPMLLGSNALRDCVMRYGNEPGKAYKFLSARCIDVLGMRGYTLVTDKAGQPVKAGTLFLAWIPEHVAELRRRKYAADSEAQLAAQQEEYLDTQERFVRAAGKAGAGSRPLSPDEVVRADASENEGAVGEDFAMGVRFERETTQK